MAYQSLGLGTTVGDGTGDTIRDGGDKINDNFVEIYTLLGTGSALTSGISATASVVSLASPTITGVASFADGSVTAPSISNTGDSNTGIYFSAADTVNVTTGGTKRIDIDSSGLDVTGAITATTTITSTGRMIVDDATEATSTTDGSLQTDGGLSVAKDIVAGDDLNLLSDSASVFFGADKDIVVSHNPDTGLLIKNANTGDDKPIVLNLQTGETDIAANDVLGSIRFNAPDETTGTDAILVAGAIDVISEGDFSSSNNAAKIAFRVGSSETATEKMSLSSAGVLTTSSNIVSGGNLVVADAGNIGSASDTDAMAIASNGVVTFSQIPVLPANTISETMMQDDAISSNELKTLSTLLIKNSGGTTLATFHTAGA
tara:strand:- start:560 stop:1681 length:1122 start_codon:yes stop_codon:yes gene_type:complete